jgi:CRISPR-associated protein Cmr4
MGASYKKMRVIALALDPVHVGAGGGRIGRVDLTIVRDPVTRVPKIPGSSLAGVYRAYVAMHYEEGRRGNHRPPYYPNCAGLGLDEHRGHCRRPDCPVCTVFGFARGAGQEGGFAGLASFTDAHVLLFPVPTRRGPMWVTSPMALERIGEKASVEEGFVQVISKEKESGEKPEGNLNLGWLLLKVQDASEGAVLSKLPNSLGLPQYMRDRLALVSDSLFPHIVNSNLEVRTSVSIDPATGAAQEKALFSYEALPRSTVLVWEVIVKNPRLFKIGDQEIRLDGHTAPATQGPEPVLEVVKKDETPDEGTDGNGAEHVLEVVKKAHPYLEHLGVGGMGTRGMGRIKVIEPMGGPSAQAGGQP